jgi:hypothetical protein
MTVNDTINQVLLFLDGEISQDRLEDWVIQEWAESTSWPNFVIDVLRLVTVNLSGAELKFRLETLINSTRLSRVA